MTAAGCVFCRIVAGEERADVVHEDGFVTAFLDVRPLFPGHVLVVPREHHGVLTDLPDPEVPRLFRVVKQLAAAVEDAMEAEGTFVAVNNRISQSVPHLHVHVVPRRKGDGLRGFFWPRTRYADDAARESARAAIAAAMRRGAT